MRQFKRPTLPQETIAPILPPEKMTSIEAVVDQTIEDSPAAEYEETLQYLTEELTAWDNLYERIAAYSKTVVWTKTGDVTLGVLSSALFNEDPRYTEYTEAWQSNAYQEGHFPDMVGQIVLDVRQELRNTLSSWDLIVTPETKPKDKSGADVKAKPSQTSRAIKEAVDVTTTRANDLRERIEREWGEVGQKMAKCSIERLFSGLRRQSSFDIAPLTKLARQAASLRNLLRVSVLIKTPPYTTKWRSLSDIVGYAGAKAFLSTATPMVHRLEERLCSPVYDLMSTLYEELGQNYCGAFDEILGEVVGTLEHVKSKAAALQSDLIRQALSRYDKRDSLLEEARSRVKISKVEVAIDKILEMVQRASLLTELETAMQEWLDAHYPQQKPKATSTGSAASGSGGAGSPSSATSNADPLNEAIQAGKP